MRGNFKVTCPDEQSRAEQVKRCKLVWSVFETLFQLELHIFSYYDMSLQSCGIVTIV